MFVVPLTHVPHAVVCLDWLRQVALHKGEDKDGQRGQTELIWIKQT